jgi:hypothetical protein
MSANDPKRTFACRNQSHPFRMIFAVWLKCHPFVFELPLYLISCKSKSKGADLMRVLIACAIVISTALGLAGCFHHQQAVVAQPLPAPPLK